MRRKRRAIDPDHVQWVESDGTEASPERVAGVQKAVRQAALESYLKNRVLPAMQQVAGSSIKAVGLSTEDPADGMEGWMVIQFHDETEVREPLPPGSIDTMIDKAFRG